MKIKIKNEYGAGKLTKVTDMEGNTIPGIRGVKIEIPLDGPITAKLDVVDVNLEVVAECQIIHGLCPLCGRAEQLSFSEEDQA